MSKYNKFAKELECKFLEARKQYADAAEKLAKAEHEKQVAYSFFEEKYIGERATKRARADAALIEAKANFDNVSRTVWADFDREKSRLTSELREAIRADAVVNPETLDTNTIELLKSGVCNSDDFQALLARFDGNSAMTKLISKYASDASKTAQDRNEQARLNIIANTARNGESAVMRSWNELSETANILSGQAHGKGERGYTQAMNSRWEELASPVVEDF